VDDLFLGIMAAMLAVIAFAIAITVACCVLAATLVGTSLWALAVGVGAFAENFGSSIWSRGGERRAARAPEPAFELYVLGQLLADFRFALSNAAGALTGVRKQLAATADGWSNGITLPLSIGLVLGGYVGTGVAALAGALIGICVGLVAATASAISWLLILGLRLADGVRRRVRRASYECPVDHERFPLPVYVCPSCGSEHARLVPGRWGILKRECVCGNTALPTTVINGRQRVPQRCPSGHPMSGFLGLVENLPIAIVGGPSSGKSAFLAGALIELDDPTAGLALEPLRESRDDYSRLVDGMRSGVPPAKTVEERPPALVAEIQGSGSSRALYAYDVAGEVYGAEDKVRGLRFLARSAGIAILIDPFSIPRVANDHAEELVALSQRILPSSEDPMRVFERLVSALRESGTRPGDVPLAVIVAKTDACGIDREIERLASTVGPAQAPKEWLAKNGAGNLVRAIEHEFRRVGWFSVSALGRMPSPGDTRPFVPRAALAPLLWVLERHNIRTARAGVAPSHTAQKLVSDAADFPLPSTAGRIARALGSTTLAALVIAIPIVIAASQIGGSGVGHAASDSKPSATGSSNIGAPLAPTANRVTSGRGSTQHSKASKTRARTRKSRGRPRRQSSPIGHRKHPAQEAGRPRRRSASTGEVARAQGGQGAEPHTGAGAPAAPHSGTAAPHPSGGAPANGSGGLQGSSTPPSGSTGGSGGRGGSGGGLQGSAQPETGSGGSGGGGLSGSAGR
jgi:hypothetical protein